MLAPNKMGALKRVPKRDLCALIRYLNYYVLVHRRIHYFSIRVKADLVADLGRLYLIAERDHGVAFLSRQGSLPNFTYLYLEKAWRRNGEKIKLPKSRRQCVRVMTIAKGKVTLTFPHTSSASSLEDPPSSGPCACTS